MIRRLRRRARGGARLFYQEGKKLLSALNARQALYLPSKPRGEGAPWAQQKLSDVVRVFGNDDSRYSENHGTGTEVPVPVISPLRYTFPTAPLSLFYPFAALTRTT